MDKDQQEAMTPENIAKAYTECRKSPSNCAECPFQDIHKPSCCISVLAVVIDEREQAYLQKYHPTDSYKFKTW